MKKIIRLILLLLVTSCQDTTPKKRAVSRRIIGIDIPVKMSDRAKETEEGDFIAPEKVFE